MYVDTSREVIIENSDMKSNKTKGTISFIIYNRPLLPQVLHTKNNLLKNWTKMP